MAAFLCCEKAMAFSMEGLQGPCFCWLNRFFGHDLMVVMWLGCCALTRGDLLSENEQGLMAMLVLHSGLLEVNHIVILLSTLIAK